MWFTTYLPRKPVAPKTVLVIPLRSVGVAGGGASVVSRELQRGKKSPVVAPARAQTRIRESRG
jgi:hypothetical protein